jgi:hypothetical protein
LTKNEASLFASFYNRGADHITFLCFREKHNRRGRGSLPSPGCREFQVSGGFANMMAGHREYFMGTTRS